MDDRFCQQRNYQLTARSPMTDYCWLETIFIMIIVKIVGLWPDAYGCYIGLLPIVRSSFDPEIYIHMCNNPTDEFLSYFD